MSFQKLEQNIDKLNDKIAESEFDISKFFMDDSQIYKNIIRLKNPTIDEESLELMFGTLEQQSDRFLTDVKQQLEGIYPLPENKYKQQVEEIKKEVKNAVSQLYKEFKSLTTLLANSTVMTISSIPALAITVTAPPWNIPDAITKCSMLIDLFFKIVDKIKSSLSLFSPIKDLKFLVDPKNEQQITSPINFIIEGILALFNPINLLGEFISNLTDFLKSLFGGEREDKAIKRVTKRLRKLDYLSGIRDEDLSKVDEEDKEEVNQILENYKVVRPRSSDNAVELRNKGELKNQIDSLQDNVEDLNKFIEENQPESTNELNNFVFDVKLPDGSILRGLTKEELNDIEKLYDFKFVSNEDF